MPTDVIMPQMGESIFEGTITKWLKKDRRHRAEGRTALRDLHRQDAEIPSPVAGVLTEIKVQEGATVEINTVVAVVSASGEAAAPPAPKAAASAPSPAPVAAADGYEEPAAKPEPAKPAPPASKAAPAAAKSAPTESASTAPVARGTDVVMPQMGESIFEGTITKWLKKTGDTVQKDEPLFEISTDKVDAEIPSPVAGVLAEIKVPEGTTVEINTVVAVYRQRGRCPGCGAVLRWKRPPPPPLPRFPRPQQRPFSTPKLLRCPTRLLCPRLHLPTAANASVHHRWSAASPRTTTSTLARFPEQARKAASQRTTFSAI